MARLQGAVVASSQCFGTSGRLALAPVADWLRNPAVQAAAAALDPAWRAEVGRLVPAGGRGERAAGSRSMADAWQRHRFFEGLARALMAVGRPVLLVLDNMQWCDQETLAFLTFFLGLAPGTPVLVAGTLRNDTLDEDPELADWTVRMRATGLMTELSLSPLDAADTARLAEAISGRPLLADDADLLQATTGGFPLYVIEAVRGSADPGGTPLPAGDLTAVLRNRLDQATAAAREVAGLAAAVGTNFTLDLLTEASDLDAGIVVGAVDELWRRRIMREFGDGYDFSHDLLRDTAYAQVSPPKRWLLHRRVAQALELLHADDTDTVSAQLAEQYARGGRPGRAVAYYRRAADVAAGMFAHAEAIRLHKEALSIVRNLPEGKDRDRQELEVLEAMAAPLNARYGYSSPQLQRTLERSIDLAESLGRRDSTLTGLVALWATQFVQGRIADGYQTATRALTLVDPDSELSGPAHFAVGGSAVSLGMPAEGLRHLELAAKLASGAVWLSVGTRADVHGTAWAAHAHWLLGHDAEALSACQAGHQTGQGDRPPVLPGRGPGLRLHHPPDAPRYVRAEGHGRRAARAVRPVRLCLLPRVGADPGRLVPPGRVGHRPRPARHRQPQDGRLVRPQAVLAVAARRPAGAERPAGRRTGGPGRRPRRRAGTGRSVVAARGDAAARGPRRGGEAAISRLRSAAEMASAHGSVGLLRRCEHDLARRGVRAPSPGVLPVGRERARTNATRTVLVLAS